MVQKTVSTRFKSGYVGSIAFAGPQRVTAMPVQTSGDEGFINNVAGRAFTYNTDGVSVTAGGTGVFAGIFINPDELKGGGIFFEDTFFENGTVISLATMAEVYAQIDKPNTAIGTKIGYKTATGELVAVADPTSLDTGVALVPNCEVSRQTSSSETPSLAVIKLTN